MLTINRRFLASTHWLLSKIKPYSQEIQTLLLSHRRQLGSVETQGSHLYISDLKNPSLQFKHLSSSQAAQLSAIYSLQHFLLSFNVL